MKLFALDVQGYYLYSSSRNSTSFHVKEITISNGKQTSHHVLKSPTPYLKMSKINKKAVCHAEKVNGIEYSAGYIDSIQIYEILDNTLKDCDILYVNGNPSYQYLRELLPNMHFKLVDITTLNNWDILQYKAQTPACMEHMDSKPYMCSKTNCVELFDWLKKHLIP